MSGPFNRSLFKTLTAATAITALAVSLAACGSDSEAESATVTEGTATVKIATAAGKYFPQTAVDVEVQDEIRAHLPASVRDSGKLVIGIGALPAGFPPLAFVGEDDKTLTGSEPDLGRLIAGVLGLTPEVVNATWDNMFVGIDSGKTDVGLSNITVTEKRKEKYDFASYRQDNLSFAVKGDNPLKFTGDPAVFEGLKIAVAAGTNQEKILVEFSDKLKEAGKKPIEIKYFADNNSTWTALESGQIDAFFGPNPTNAYYQSETGDKIKIAGIQSGAGATLQGLIAATVKKGSGLAEPIAEAIDYLIEGGQYATWIKTYNLANESIPKAEVNAPGLPLDNS